MADNTAQPAIGRWGKSIPACFTLPMARSGPPFSPAPD